MFNGLYGLMPIDYDAHFTFVLESAYYSNIVSVLLTDNTAGKTYIMMEARLGALFKSEGEYTLLDK